MDERWTHEFKVTVLPGFALHLSGVNILDDRKTVKWPFAGKIVKLKITNHIEPNLKKSVQDSDLVIICTPLGTYKNIVSVIKNNLKNTCILTDVGSAKIFVTNTVNKLINQNTNRITKE